MSQEYALVISGGAFGTSIASVLACNFKKVFVKVRSEQRYQELSGGENKTYLPGQSLSERITPVLGWEDIPFDKINIIVSGLPTKALIGYFAENHEYIDKMMRNDIPFVSLSKGIDPDTLLLPDDILFNELPEYQDQICFLSGPSFAKEIVDKQITIVSLAGKSRDTLERIASLLDTNFFKVFPTYDIKGVLLGGALKNVIAIACGIIEGLGYNHNTRAALITRGIQEMLRFGEVFNARPETFYGYSGMGDLILTSTGGLSRNKVFGLEIAKGRSPKEIIESSQSVVEGYRTAKAVTRLAEKYKIKTTVFDGVYKVLYEEVPPQKILEKVMESAGSF